MNEPFPKVRFTYEYAYQLLWAAIALSLILAGKLRITDLWMLPLIFISAVLTHKARQGRWLQARLWIPVISLNATYTWLGNAIPRLHVWRADAALLSIDQFLFGDCLAVKVAPFISFAGKEVLSACYFSFFLMWLLSLPVAARKGLEFQKAYFRGFHLLYALGYIGYLLVPAAGPFRYPPIAEKLTHFAPGGAIWHLNNTVINTGCNGVDVFPSLHTAVTLFVLLSSYRISRCLFAVLLIPCCLIIFSTIGLHYHYLADVVAGALLSTAVWWNTVRKYQPHSI